MVIYGALIGQTQVKRERKNRGIDIPILEMAEITGGGCIARKDLLKDFSLPHPDCQAVISVFFFNFHAR